MLILHIHAHSLVASPEGEGSPNPRTTPTLWHRLTPQARVLCVLPLLLAIVFTPNGQWPTWGVYGLGIAALLWLARVSPQALMQRLAVESAFVSVVILGTLFREGGEVLWRWGWLQITTHGLLVLGSVTCKTLLSLLLLNLLTLTTAVPQLLEALVALRTPPLLVAILASMYRYLDVLIEEFQVMSRAAAARNLLSHPGWHRVVIGSMIGSLFIRTYERGDRIYQAMLARGYQGQTDAADLPPLKQRDRLAIILVAVFACIGQGMIFLL